jgi:hypothetical protein
LGFSFIREAFAYMIWRRAIWAITLIFLASCALNEGPPVTPPPPLTLEAPTSLQFEGDCNNNRDLANWLQFTAYHVGEFAKLVSMTATMGPIEMRENILALATKRETVAQTPAPDCAEPAHRLVIETMNRAIDAFQARTNGEPVDLSRIVAEILGQFDQIAIVYEDLNARLEAQLEERTTSDS